MKNIVKIPIETITKPQNGLFRVYVDYWWTVTPNNEVLLWKNRSPQCNRSKETQKRIQEDLYPDYDIKLLPVAYVAVDPKDFC